jgi:hypothetical protein
MPNTAMKSLTWIFSKAKHVHSGSCSVKLPLKADAATPITAIDLTDEP